LNDSFNEPRTPSVDSYYSFAIGLAHLVRTWQNCGVSGVCGRTLDDLL